MLRTKLAAGLLAGACLAVGLYATASASPGDGVSAQSPGGVAGKAASAPRCPRRTVCLYPDKNLGGAQLRYHCRRQDVRGTRRHSTLPNFPTGPHAGVSSYQNNGVPSATLVMILRPDRAEPFRLRRDVGGNIPSDYNDAATALALIC